MGSFYKPVNEQQTVSATADKSITGFWWKHAPTKGLQNIDDGALYLWNRGKQVGGKFKEDPAGTLFSSLTRNEKLKLIEDYLREVYLGIAQQQHLENAIETARTTALEENQTLYELVNGE